MTFLEYVARTEHRTRKLLHYFPPWLSAFLFTNGRKIFLNAFVNQKPYKIIEIPPEFRKTLWGIEFGSPLFNAAGMFKNGDGYNLAASQGAGAFLAGTTTFFPRNGNHKKGIKHPFVAYPKSYTASNWMGLPNISHEKVAAKLLKIEKNKICPVGISVAASPEQHGTESLEAIVTGMRMYESAGVDFIELNESCPNVPHGSCQKVSGIDNQLIDRLEYISLKFLKSRTRNLPVIVKFSNDTEMQQIPELVNVLVTLGFDGVNIGNTSTDYKAARSQIALSEQTSFDYFTRTFGGGLSGRILKHKSLNLASFAASLIKNNPPTNEFHVIRTGGIENWNDLKESDAAGISLNQWFTGYFDAFSCYGHELYKEFFWHTPC